MADLVLTSSNDDYWWLGCVKPDHKICNSSALSKTIDSGYSSENTSTKHLLSNVSNNIQFENKTEGAGQSFIEQKSEEPKEKNKMKIKRPSGAQRRKRKWLRVETELTLENVNKIQYGFERLNVNKVNDTESVFSEQQEQNCNVFQRNIHTRKTVNNTKFQRRNQFVLHKSISEQYNHLPGCESLRCTRQCLLSQKTKSENHFSPNNFQREYENNSNPENFGDAKCNAISYSSILQNKLDAVIIDESNPEGTITYEQSDLIVDKLMTKLSEFPFTSSSEVPRFQGYHLIKGVLTINCVDELSMEWLMKANLTDLWDDAKLKIMRANEFAKLVKLTAFVPGPVRDNIEMLKLLKTQNAELNTSRWRIYHRSEGTSTGVTLVLAVDEKSLQVLKSLEMKPYYGMSRASFYLPDKHKGKQSS